MTDYNASRQLLLLDPAQANIPVTIFGAGGIGSPTALLLAKMGVRDITLIDFDTVGFENLRSQIYGLADAKAKRPKVDAARDILAQFTDCDLKTECAKYEGGPVSGIVISAVDCMPTRKRIWEAAKVGSQELFIDGRMGGEMMDIFTARPYDPDDIAYYEQFLFSEEDASPRKCGDEAIVYCTFGAAAFIARLVRGWLTDTAAPRRIVGDYNTISFTIVR